MLYPKYLRNSFKKEETKATNRTRSQQIAAYKAALLNTVLYICEYN